ncbi:MAG: hypothetical protein INR71_16195, partial [Terriglobus roseus]|nr:hypothetical protein [Terriglobus roseus]
MSTTSSSTPSARPTLTARLSGVPGRLKSGNGQKTGSAASRSASPRPGGRGSMADARGNGGNYLHLRATVVKGRNLAAKDKSGTSDPVCELLLHSAACNCTPSPFFASQFLVLLLEWWGPGAADSY